MQKKLYISPFDAKFTWKHFVKKPFKWVIKLFTGSNYNHIADNYSYCNRGKYINQAVGSGYESIHYMECFKKRDSNIYAYEIIVPIDFDKWHKDTMEQIGKPYAALEAPYSVIDRIPVFSDIWKKLLQVSEDDDDLFCMQAVIKKLQNQGYLKNIGSSNNINPEEGIKLLLKYGLANNRVHVWNGKRIINNIFE